MVLNLLCERFSKATPVRLTGIDELTFQEIKKYENKLELKMVTVCVSVFHSIYDKTKNKQLRALYYLDETKQVCNLYLVLQILEDMHDAKENSGDPPAARIFAGTNVFK